MAELGEAIRLAREHDNLYDLGEAHGNYAQELHHLGRPDEAREVAKAGRQALAERRPVAVMWLDGTVAEIALDPPASGRGGGAAVRPSSAGREAGACRDSAVSHAARPGARRARGGRAALLDELEPIGAESTDAQALGHRRRRRRAAAARGRPGRGGHGGRPAGSSASSSAARTASACHCCERRRDRRRRRRRARRAGSRRGRGARRGATTRGTTCSRARAPPRARRGRRGRRAAERPGRGRPRRRRPEIPESYARRRRRGRRSAARARRRHAAGARPRRTPRPATATGRRRRGGAGRARALALRLGRAGCAGRSRGSRRGPPEPGGGARRDRRAR
jgi:hypothetical protein